MSQAGPLILTQPPKIGWLLLKAAFKRAKKFTNNVSHPRLPSTRLVVNNMTMDYTTLGNCHEVVQWPSSAGFVHPSALHIMAFPLQLKLLLLAECPFPLLGLIHIKNTIKQYQAVRLDHSLTFECCFAELSIHPKGWVIRVEVTALHDQQVVWQSFSDYLYRCKHNQPTNKAKHATVSQQESTKVFRTELKANLGRKYAKVSKDFNPIHLSTICAKLFGFKQSIAHGMWLKSYALSSLHQSQQFDLTSAFAVTVEFKAPIYLPNRISMTMTKPQQSSEKTYFFIQPENASSHHLVGSIQTIGSDFVK